MLSMFKRIFSLLGKQKFLLAILGLVIIISAIILFSKFKKDNELTPIVLTAQGFNPPNLEVKIDSTVIFKTELSEDFWPASDIHPTHGIYPEFDPQAPIKAGESWKFKFGKTGTWRYHDHLNPLNQGTITVIP